MPQKNDEYSAAWKQFLVARSGILAAYDRALAHSRDQVVSTHHGVVGEAAVRDWLASFLPKRYGVAPGYVRTQGVPKPYQTGHFDVIIYDQLEAPTLWIEENKDKSDSGRAKIIPAEFVKAVLEVKSAFNRRTVREAISKLEELQPLMAGFETGQERYPKYLPAFAVLAMVFIELRAADRDDFEALNLVRDVEFKRRFYGPVILRGEGLNPDFTALIHKYTSNEPHSEVRPAAGLLGGFAMTATRESKAPNLGAHMMWSDIFFSDFAFDLLALLNGTYRPGYASSFYGMEITGTL
jgi:hypothetical protein